MRNTVPLDHTGLCSDMLSYLNMARTTKCSVHYYSVDIRAGAHCTCLAEIFALRHGLANISKLMSNSIIQPTATINFDPGIVLIRLKCV